MNFTVDAQDLAIIPDSVRKLDSIAIQNAATNAMQNAIESNAKKSDIKTERKTAIKKARKELKKNGVKWHKKRKAMKKIKKALNNTITELKSLSNTDTDGNNNSKYQYVSNSNVSISDSISIETSTYYLCTCCKNDSIEPVPVIAYKKKTDTSNVITLNLKCGNLPNAPQLLNQRIYANWQKYNKDTTYMIDTIFALIKCKKINTDSLDDVNKYSGKIFINKCDSNFVTLNLCNKKIAKSRLQIFAALYSTPTTVRADDPKLTQTYIRFNIPIKELNGIDYDAPFRKRCIFFRNIFTQVTYTTNSNNVNYIDSTSYRTNNLSLPSNYRSPILDSPFSARHVNRLDLLENANLNLSITLPVLTYVIPQIKDYKGDFAHLYFETFYSLLGSTVSRANDTTTTVPVYSLMPGFDIGLRTEHTFLQGVPLFVELTAKIYWIIPLSNSITPDLNFQYAKLSDYNVMMPGKHLLDPSNHPYYNFDALILYNTNKNNADSSSNVFAHFSFITNIVRPTTSNTGHVFNNFMQIQVGYGLNISTFISQIQNKSTSNTSSIAGN